MIQLDPAGPLFAGIVPPCRSQTLVCLWVSWRVHGSMLASFTESFENERNGTQYGGASVARRGRAYPRIVSACTKMAHQNYPVGRLVFGGIMKSKRVGFLAVALVTFRGE